MHEAILSLVSRTGPGMEVVEVVHGLKGLGHAAKAPQVEAEMKLLAERGRLYRIGAYWWGRK